uniref:Uncharacterized protein n=1 Tax=Megaselia scalaris TaxID=36166 RepID=T1H6B0_MEGSC
NMSLNETKRIADYKAVNDGSPVVFAVYRLPERLQKWLKVVCIQTSFQARKSIVEQFDSWRLDRFPHIDCAIDDELGEQYKKGIPIELKPLGYVPIKAKLEKAFGGEAKLRIAASKAVTDSGNFILDWHFDASKTFDTKINAQLLQIAGDIETGLFVGMATKTFGM